MAIWKNENFVVTNVGDEMLSQAVAGEGGIKITRIVTGASYVSPENLKEQTEIEEIKQTLEIVGVETDNEGSRITARLSNKGLTEKYTLYQIGIYATLGSNTTELLYMLAQCDFAYPDIIPAAGDTPQQLVYNLYVKHRGTDNITFNISDTMGVTPSMFDNLKKSTENSIETIQGKMSDISENLSGISENLNGHLKDKVAHITAEERTAWNAKAETDTATTSTDGLMSFEDKAKLDGIENNAEANVQPDWEIVDENSDAFIKNKPESLPANGGNADTLDGFHAKEITSNPNLLINPDFKINQRGSTTYTGKCYTVDRWFNSGVYSVSTITDNGIKIGMIEPSGGTSDTTIGQIGTQLEQETALLLRGKKITFSINVTKLTAVGAKMMILERSESGKPTYTTVKIASTGINTCQTTIRKGTTKIDVRIYGVDTREDGEVYTNYTVVQWAKLEVGSFPTIFTPPDPATELLKCQRYYQKISGLNNHFGSGFIVATYIAGTIINLPTPLNKKPTVVLNGNIYLNTKGYVATKAISCNSDSIIGIVPNDTNSIFTITYNIGSDKSAILGQACTAQFRDETSYIEFDAEMDI